MFHKFAAMPSGARAPRNRTNQPSSNSGSMSMRVSAPKTRHKVSRACDNCRRNRIKCGDKPCTHCKAKNIECVLSDRLLASASQGAVVLPSSSSNTLIPSHSSTPDSFVAAMVSDVDASLSNTESVANSGHQMDGHSANMAKNIRGFFKTGAPHDIFVRDDTLFPQLPHQPVPSEDRPMAVSPLSEDQRSYYLRLFWDTCHPLYQVLSETEFRDIDARVAKYQSLADVYSAETALVDIMTALGIQSSYSTGLSSRIMGLQDRESNSFHIHDNNNVTQSNDGNRNRNTVFRTSDTATTWTGFEYFRRCRDCMRNNADQTIAAFQSHALMVLYLLKANAFRDAYNMIGISIRKAYLAALHRPPPSNVPPNEKTARRWLWWMLFVLDFQCSLQLGVPTATQTSIATASIPQLDEAVSDYYAPTHADRHGNIFNVQTYSINLMHLVAILININASSADIGLIQHDHAILDRQASTLSSALENLETWRSQLPHEFRFEDGDSRIDSSTMPNFHRELGHLPTWLQRQRISLELQYHNAYVLIQRPFLALCHMCRPITSHTSSTSARQAVDVQSQKSGLELHLTGALHHAILLVRCVHTVCSQSDIFYGWSELLQPLWNATVTIIAYVHVNALSSMTRVARDSLAQAKAILQAFPTTCPSALLARGAIISLCANLDNVAGEGSGNTANVASLQEYPPPQFDDSFPLYDQYQPHLQNTTYSGVNFFDDEGLLPTRFPAAFANLGAIDTYDMAMPTEDGHFTTFGT